MALVNDWIQENFGKALLEGPSSSTDVIEQCLDCIKEHFDCSICRDSLDKPIQTQCGHVFCEKCLNKITTCPLCKKPISNRALVIRDDIGDMIKLVKKLNNVFNEELRNFWGAKGRETGCNTSVISVEKTPKKVIRSGKSPTPRKQFDKKENCSASKKDEEKEAVKKPKNGDKCIKEGKVQDSNKPNLADENIQDIDNSLIEPTTTTSRNKVVRKHKEKEAAPLNVEHEKSKEISKEEEVEQMMSQQYAIVTAGVIAEPLDLSVKGNRSGQKFKYIPTPSAIRFIKPLDLSMKNEKRKFEEVDLVDENLDSRSKALMSEKGQANYNQKSKKGKFENNEKVIHKKATTLTTSNSKPKDTKASTLHVEALRPDNDFPQVDFENPPESNDNDEDESLMEDEPELFTPTPPPASVQKDLPATKMTKEIGKISTQKSNDRSEHRSTGISDSNYFASEIMRDFDRSFEESGELPNPSLGGKVITNSDEILGKIAEEFSWSSKYKSQSKLLPPSKEKKTDAITKKTGNQDSFTFKQPVSAVSQAPKKSKNEPIRKNDMDINFDDDFQKPRDSDLLFLDVSMSGCAGGGSDDGKKKRKRKPRPRACVNMAHGSGHLSDSSSSSGSDNEKENGADVPTSSKNKRDASPAKSRPTKIAKQSKKPAYEDRHENMKNSNQQLDEFDKNDEGWLLDIPEPSGSNQVKAGREEPKKISKTPKQRYVFCPTRLDKNQNIKLQELCKMCDGKITKSFTPDVTHLVIQLCSGRVPQTLKYLLAIAGRKWVVIYDWIEKCLESGEVVSEIPYETSNFEKCDPGVRRSRLSKEDLFDGFKFHFATSIYTNLGFTKSEVMMLLENLGATVVDSADTRYRDLIIIGSVNGNSTEYNDWLNTNKWVTVTFDWVIECILEYRLKPFEPKHLCVDALKVKSKSIHAPKAFQTAFSQYILQKSQGMSPF